MVSACLCLAQAVPCNFCNNMSRRESFRATHKTFLYDNRGEDGIEFVRCVDGRELQTHKLWSFSKDRITREVYPFARVDVGDFLGDCLQTHYMTEEACRVTVFWPEIY